MELFKIKHSYISQFTALEKNLHDSMENDAILLILSHFPLFGYSINVMLAGKSPEDIFAPFFMLSSKQNMISLLLFLDKKALLSFNCCHWSYLPN